MSETSEPTPEQIKALNDAFWQLETSKPLLEYVPKLFNIYDKNGGGYLDKAEVAGVLESFFLGGDNEQEKQEHKNSLNGMLDDDSDDVEWKNKSVAEKDEIKADHTTHQDWLKGYILRSAQRGITAVEGINGSGEAAGAGQLDVEEFKLLFFILCCQSAASEETA